MEKLSTTKHNKIVMTNTIGDYMVNDTGFAEEIANCIKRHLNNDFGNLCEEDIDMNMKALANDLRDDRILSRYETKRGDIYIITDIEYPTQDNEDMYYLTTVLFTEEY